LWQNVTKHAKPLGLFAVVVAGFSAVSYYNAPSEQDIDEAIEKAYALVETKLALFGNQDTKEVCFEDLVTWDDAYDCYRHKPSLTLEVKDLSLDCQAGRTKYTTILNNTTITMSCFAEQAPKHGLAAWYSLESITPIPKLQFYPDLISTGEPKTYIAPVLFAAEPKETAIPEE